jgi:diguanylate cyclase (GGDEF)-like protein
MYRYKLTLNYNNQLLNINKELEKLNIQLEELSQTDQLTQVSNRRHLDTTLSSEIKRSRRYRSKLCVLLLDIDHFKKVNDTFGHPKGDEILKGVAKILNENSRQIDTVGRWGGEEFLIILSQVDLHHSTSMAEKLRELIKAYDFGLGYAVTASFGITEFDIEHDDEYSLLSRVDSNLYEAKEQGRDKIIAS